MHSTLKASLRKLCSDKPREWHRYLIPTLFALQEIPSDRTGFSAFELLYGRQVRGPLTVLRDLWEDRKVTHDERTSFQYVIELREKLEVCAKLAAQNAEVSRSKYKSYFDLKSQDRKFKPSDEVLVLLPDNSSKLLMTWRGPFVVLEWRNKVTYLINEDGKSKLYHINLLKKYYRRAQVGQAQVLDEVPTLDPSCRPTLTVQVCALDENAEIEEDSDDSPITPDGLVGPEDPNVSSDSNICSDLSSEKRTSIDNLINKYKDVFSDIPGCTSAIKHDINLTTTERLKSNLYPIDNKHL